MTVVQAIILGVVQGLSEFLPISSSGHLILVPWLCHWPPHSKTFDVALHFGTFLGVALYFAGDILRLARALVRVVVERTLAADPDRKLACFVIASTLPGAVAGVLFGDVIEQRLGSPLLIGVLLIAVGVVLGLAEFVSRRRREMADLGWADAWIIGLAQALALVPGTSRSGITIATGLFGNLTRATAARYSFLISIPIIGGAAAASGVKLLHAGMPAGMAWPFVAGVLSAAVSGYAVIRFFLAYLQRWSLYPFVAYRIVVGAVVVYLAVRGVV